MKERGGSSLVGVGCRYKYYSNSRGRTMKKLHIMATAILISGVLLLGGCLEQGNSYTPGTDIDLSSDISESYVPDSTSSLTSSDSTGNSENSGSTSSMENLFEQSSDVSVKPVPVEFTEEDKELQKILEGLNEGTNAICAWFTRAEPNSDYNPISKFFSFDPSFSDAYSEPYTTLYYLIPDNYFEAGMIIPNTQDGMRKVMLEYLSEDRVNACMEGVDKGSLIENSDGTFSVISEEGSLSPVKFIEIDGVMYRNHALGGRGLGINGVISDTAKVTQRTDDTIEFTYLIENPLNYDNDGNPKYIDNVSLYYENVLEGALKFERGGWKRDFDKDEREWREKNGLLE